MPSKEGTSDKPWERWEALDPSCCGWKKRKRDEVLDVGSWEELDSPD